MSKTVILILKIKPAYLSLKMYQNLQDVFEIQSKDIHALQEQKSIPITCKDLAQPLSFSSVLFSLQL